MTKSSYQQYGFSEDQKDVVVEKAEEHRPQEQQFCIEDDDDVEVQPETVQKVQNKSQDVFSKQIDDEIAIEDEDQCAIIEEDEEILQQEEDAPIQNNDEESQMMILEDDELPAPILEKTKQISQELKKQIQEQIEQPQPLKQTELQVQQKTNDTKSKIQQPPIQQEEQVPPQQKEIQAPPPKVIQPKQKQSPIKSDSSSPQKHQDEKQGEFTYPLYEPGSKYTFHQFDDGYQRDLERNIVCPQGTKEEAQANQNLIDNQKPKDPSKLKPTSALGYDPIKDAPFLKGQSIPFGFISSALSEIEQCKGRKSQHIIKEIISNVFRSAMILSPKDVPNIFYFLCIKLGPDYDTQETGIGLELLSNSVAKACGKTVKQIRENFKAEGDYGLVIEKCKGIQKSIGNFFSKQEVKKKPITFIKVFEAFQKIAKCQGNNSQSEKEAIILKMLQDASNEEAKYIVRWLQKNLKTGAAEKTFLAALARAVAYTPPNKLPAIINARRMMNNDHLFFTRCNQIEHGIKEAICEFPNYGEVIKQLLIVGDDMVKLKEKCFIRVGIPVKPMLAKPTKGVREVLDRFEQLKFTCEYKYDGFRGQIHFDRSNTEKQVQIYSRNLESMTNQYPDVVEFVKNKVRDSMQNFILDSELIAYDTINKRIMPFQVLTQRSRKNVTEEDLKTKICICAFDLLYINGKSLMKEPFQYRRDILHKNFDEDGSLFMFAKHKDADAIAEIEDFLAESVKDSCEGLMVKTLITNATYEPSKRSLNWLKLKKDYLETGFGDSLDLVVVGADFGKGKRAGLFGSFLMACYDENFEQIQTVTKMGSGLSDEMMLKVYNRLKDLVIDKPPHNLKYHEKNVDVWIQPTYVWEVKCADLSLSPIYCASMGSVEANRGIALRFPRFIREREDKRVEDATTSDQILEFFKSQPQHLNKEAEDDDFEF